jgi:hypothetical protein
MIVKENKRLAFLMMMMPFICSCRNNKKPTAIHPFGYPPGMI